MDNIENYTSIISDAEPNTDENNANTICNINVNSDSDTICGQYTSVHIKHLVISGGGICGIYAYGCITELEKYKFINMDNIESIYATSMGAIITILLCLKYDIDTIENYIINRPWHELCKNSVYSFIDSYMNRGLYNQKFIESVLFPLFKGRNIDPNITMRDFYAIHGIDIHIFSVELNEFKIIDMSYKNYGDWRVIDVVYTSCSIPLIFSPIIRENECYVDGGFLVNYPILECPHNSNNVLGIHIKNVFNMKPTSKITVLSNIVDFMMSVFMRIFEMNTRVNKYHTPANTSHYEIKIYNVFSLDEVYDAFTKPEKRENILYMGKQYAKEWLDKLTQYHANNTNNS